MREHKEYKKDSVVTDGMAYDLVKAAERITVNEGRDGYALELLGEGRERPN